MNITILSQTTTNLTGNRGNGGGRENLCSLRFLLFNTCTKILASALLLARAGSALAATHYVDVNSTNATPPYTNWTTAATNIQDAVDAAVAGDEVVVTNGVYATGSRDNEAGASRVAVDKPLTVRSVNGPQFTLINGGGFGRRCVYLTNGATLSGFTLTNGVTVDPGISYVNGGGGVWCAGSNAVVSNCVISGNQALTYWGDASGGGAYGGTLNNCTLVGNSVHYVVPGFPIPDVTACGGGAAYCTLNYCTLSGNSVAFDRFAGEAAAAEGGGAAWCMLNNCTLVGNSASVFFGFHPACGAVAGGGAFGCTLNNCTVAGNAAAGDRSFPQGCGGISHGGTSGCALTNCINFENTYWALGLGGSHEVVCEDCGPPGHLFGANWYGDPLFVDTNGWANLRLRSNSPCINAGNNSYVTSAMDLDGNPRIAGSTVDLGAYEFQSPVSMISYAWLQQFNLPINPATDSADPDGDGVDNYHEWLAGTDPTNPFSSPAKLAITPSGVPPSGIILAWSTNAVGFSLQSTTNLVSPAVWSTNSPAPVVIGGKNTVTNPITGAQQFYRLIR